MVINVQEETNTTVIVKTHSPFHGPYDPEGDVITVRFSF